MYYHSLHKNLPPQKSPSYPRKAISIPSYGGFRSAFTLIELLIVIAIIAVLSVVVILTLNAGYSAF